METVAVIGKKIDQSQRFLTDRTRIPVTIISVPGNLVVAVKSKEKDGYTALQLGIGEKKHPTKALFGHTKKAFANLKSAVLHLREVRMAEEDLEGMPKVGETLLASSLFKPGDIVDVIGISKGKGYAGVVKRHHFKGGPRTHGQSDRERAPGSIGQTTTPGRVYKGKRMAGRMGQDKVTMKNLLIVDVLDDIVIVKGLVPGIRNSMVMLKKAGEAEKFVPLFKEEGNNEIEEKKEEQKDNAGQ